MASLVHQCPHCSATNVTLRTVGQSAKPLTQHTNRHFVHLSCTNCCMPSSAEVVGANGAELGQLAHMPFSLNQHGFAVKAIWPAPPRPRIPGSLPDEVARAFLAAERNFPLEGMEEASAGSYGRALDVGTKILAPDFKGMLNARIQELAKQNKITADLAAWAHEIRLIRNYAMHEIDGTTRDELIAIRGFTEMVLTYLFTLPAMLAARKADAGAAGGGSAPTPQV